MNPWPRSHNSLIPRLLLVMAATSLSQNCAALAIHEIVIPESDYLLIRAEVRFGTTDSCGASQAPHLIEHIVLADTPGGKTLADLLSHLGKDGISLSAVTRQDHTAFTISGPASKAEKMVQTIIETIGRKTLPASALEQEKRAITTELNESPGFTSQPSAFEMFSEKHLNGSTVACSADSAPMQSLTITQLQEKFDAAYVGQNISIIAVGPQLSDLLQGAKKAILASKGDGVKLTHNYITSVSDVPPVEILGKIPRTAKGFFEVRIGIPGRNYLSNRRAKALAEVLRLDVQRVLRNEKGVYYVSAIVHQSNSTGWISLAADLAPEESAGMVKPVTTALKDSISILIAQGIPYFNPQNMESMAEEAQAAINIKSGTTLEVEALRYAEEKIQVRYFEKETIAESAVRSIRDMCLE